VPVSRTEFVVLLAITVAGFAARFAFLDELAVEHFDEGVYASNLWFPDEGYQYPDRFLYAPPLVPGLIEWSMILFGPARWAPFLPALILGSLTVPLAWWSVRRWANGASGVAAAALISLSDFHIAMSRLALTDAPMVFFLLLAVWLAVEALSDRNLRLATVAGFATGLAWATKYNGWLPIAISVSGSGAAWLFWPRGQESGKFKEDRLSASSIALCLVVLAAAAALTWSPVWWELQPIGGYARVADNHRNYVTGFADWWPATIRHEAVQRHYAGWPTLLSGWLAVVSAALVLRVEGSTWNGLVSRHDDSQEASPGAVKRGVKRSTWNNEIGPARLLASATSAATSDSTETLKDRSTWNRLELILPAVIAAGLTGAVVLSPLIALGVWSLTELVASAMTLRQNQQRRLSPSTSGKEASKQQTKGRAKSVGKLATSEDYNGEQRAWFGTWLHLAWLGGLFLATPLYRPYPRLILPLLCVGSLATGMAIVRLLNGKLVARQSTKRTLASASVTASGNLSGNAPQDDKAIVDQRVDADLANAHDNATSGQLRFVWLAPVVCLCIWRAVAYPASAWQDRSALSRIADLAVAAAAENCKDEPGPTADLDFVVYVYGEPGLFFHIPRDGVPVQPIMDLSFAQPGSDHPRVPTFVLAGPHAWQSSQFGVQYRELPEDSLMEVAEFPYRVSDFVLLDYHAPKLLAKYRNDVVKLYRVQFR
jgi:dolichyl-phosphate-mannose-protein mannosyltransferase